MNKDRIEGASKQVAGTVQKKFGEAVNSPEHQIKGAAKKTEGNLQNSFGKMKDKAEEVSKKAS